MRFLLGESGGVCRARKKGAPTGRWPEYLNKYVYWIVGQAGYNTHMKGKVMSTKLAVFVLFLLALFSSGHATGQVCNELERRVCFTTLANNGCESPDRVCRANVNARGLRIGTPICTCNNQCNSHLGCRADRFCDNGKCVKRVCNNNRDCGIRGRNRCREGVCRRP